MQPKIAETKVKSVGEELAAVLPPCLQKLLQFLTSLQIYIFDHKILLKEGAQPVSLCLWCIAKIHNGEVNPNQIGNLSYYMELINGNFIV